MIDERKFKEALYEIGAVNNFGYVSCPINGINIAIDKVKTTACWVKTGDKMHCSACGKDYYAHLEYAFKYCPNCGTDMGGEE